VKYAYPTTVNFDAAGRADFNWYKERTGYVLLNGTRQYNY
jgi:hypothetical protein